MAQSLTKIINHITFSTKNHLPLIDAKIESLLHAYLAKVCNQMEYMSIQVGGYVEHVHIVCVVSKKLALVDLLEEIKKRSSKWIKTQGVAYADMFRPFRANTIDYSIL